MIFLVGHHAAGKTEIANVLKERFNFLHIETSGVVKDYKRQTMPDTPMDQWVEYISTNFGLAFLDQLIVDYMRDSVEARSTLNIPFQEIVVTGNRSPHGVRYIVDHMREIIAPQAFQPKVIAVSASDCVLYTRYVSRNREAGDNLLTVNTFQAILERERRAGLAELIQSSHHTFLNEGASIGTLQAEVHSVFAALGYVAIQESLSLEISEGL